MKGFEIKFNVYANSQAEADAATASIKAFISDKAARGVAVTATKISDALARFKDNYFVNQYLTK